MPLLPEIETVTRYKTPDGRTFESRIAATRHTQHLTLLELVKAEMVAAAETIQGRFLPSDIVEMLLANRETFIQLLSECTDEEPADEKDPFGFGYAISKPGEGGYRFVGPLLSDED